MGQLANEAKVALLLQRAEHFKTHVSGYLPVELVQAIDRLAAQRGVARNQILLEAVRAYLENADKTQKPAQPTTPP